MCCVDGGEGRVSYSGYCGGPAREGGGGGVGQEEGVEGLAIPVKSRPLQP